MRYVSIVLLLLIAGPVSAQMLLSEIKIDTSITRFHFTAEYNGTLVYTQNGHADMGVVKNPSAFSVTLIPDADYESARDEIEQLMEISSAQDGNTQDQIVRKDTIVNGYKAYTVSLRETKKGSLYHNLIFYGVYLIDHTALLFISGDLDKGKYISQFKKTFYTLKLRNNQ